MGNTKIPYVDKAWNFAVGCSKIAPGCLHCWSEDLHNKRHKAYLAGKHVAPQYAMPFSKVQLLPERLEQPLHWRRPRDIFVCSQSDLFHEKISNDQIYDTLWMARYAPQHRYFIFSKRIERAYDLLTNHFFGGAEDNSWPFDNVWLMLSLSTQKEADEKIPILWDTNIAHRGLSIEPMLEDLDIRPYLPDDQIGGVEMESWPEWIICGCESGPRRRPCPIEGVRRIVRDCQAANLALWVKQLEIGGVVRHDMKYFPEDLRIQEKPK